jgi:hypothetical protein
MIELLGLRDRLAQIVAAPACGCVAHSVVVSVVDVLDMVIWERT